MNVRKILEQHLDRHGFDGLWNSNIECGCLLDDLCPCDNIDLDCEPGYKIPSDNPEFDWLITSEKPKETKT